MPDLGANFQDRVVGLDRSEIGHQCNYERLRYCLAPANRNRPVHVCHRARTLRDKPMAFRLSHSLQDAFRYALRPQKTEVGARICLNIFDHRSAFTDTLCVLCHCFTWHGNEREPQ